MRCLRFTFEIFRFTSVDEFEGEEETEGDAVVEIVNLSRSR